jgi:MFS family permease
MGGNSAARWRTLLVLCLVSAGWAFSFGVGATLSPLWLGDAGLSAKVRGLNTSIYYLGIALASLFVPRLMARADRSCMVAGIVVDAAVTALFPWTESPTVWHLLRLAGGIASAMALIPMETRVNCNAPSEYRARDFGFYAFSVALGVGLGTVVGLELYAEAPRLGFALGGAVTLAAAVLAQAGLPAAGGAVEGDGSGEPLVLERHLLSLGSAWVQGFLEGATVTFLPLYLIGLGHGKDGAGDLMGSLFLGVILIQVPVAWLADHLGRMRVLVLCHLVLLIGLVCLPWCVRMPSLAGWLFAVGGTCSALYPLGLALLGERAGAGALARGNSWYQASNSAGSLCGPFLVGLAIDGFGQRAQFAAGAAAVVAVLLLPLVNYWKPAIANRRREVGEDCGSGNWRIPDRMVG